MLLLLLLLMMMMIIIIMIIIIIIMMMAAETYQWSHNDNDRIFLSVLTAIFPGKPLLY